MENKEQGNEKKKMDPGWNDPPMLKYDASNPPPKSRITNKRVAFPLSSNLTTTSMQTMPLQPVGDCVCDSAPIPCEELYQKAKENFDKVLLEPNPPISKDNVESLLKKLQEKECNIEYRNTIYLFSKHLVEHNKEDIDRVRLQLASLLPNVCQCPSDT